MSKVEEDLFHFFIGYTRSNPKISESLINDSWADYAQKEIERRRVKLVESFSHEDLQAITNGDIDLNDIIRRATDTHH